VTTARGIGDGAAVFDGGALRHPGGEQIVVGIDLGVRRGRIVSAAASRPSGLCGS